MTVSPEFTKNGVSVHILHTTLLRLIYTKYNNLRPNLKVILSPSVFFHLQTILHKIILVVALRIAGEFNSGYFKFKGPLFTQ